MKRYTAAACVLVAVVSMALWYLNAGKGDAQLSVAWDNEWPTAIGPPQGGTGWVRVLKIKNVGKSDWSMAAFYSLTGRPSVLELEKEAEQAVSTANLSPGDEFSTPIWTNEEPSNISHAGFVIVLKLNPTDLWERLERRKRYPWLKPILSIPYTAIQVPPTGHPSG